MLTPVLMIAIPLLLAFIAVLFKKISNWVLATGAVLNIAVIAFLEKGDVIIGGFKAPYGINLILDNYSMVGITIIGVLFFAGVFISKEKANKYSVVLLTALAGLNGMMLTGDLFNLFVFMEIAVISAYILSTAGKRLEHSFNYLVLGSVGSVFYLLGIILLYSITGTLNMADMAAKLAGTDSVRMTVPIFLIFAGIAVEAKLIPVGGWVKGVFGNADRLTGAFFSSIFAATILLVFGRLFAEVLPLSETAVIIMTVIGVITFILGEATAFRQTSIRKILLYSSIGQSGLAVTLLVSGLIFPAVLVIVNNAISKFIMFTVAGKLNEDYGTDDYRNLKGTFYRNKIVGVAFSISALSLIGMPLFFGFYAKINALMALFAGGDYIIPAVIVLITVVEGAYFIRLLIALWAPGEEGQEAKKEYAAGEIKLFDMKKSIALLLLALIILTAGLIPDYTGKVLSSDENFLNGSGPAFYMSQLKGGE